MVEHDDELRIYYCGKINGHGLRHSKVTETIVEGRKVKGASDWRCCAGTDSCLRMGGNRWGS